MNTAFQIVAAGAGCPQNSSNLDSLIKETFYYTIQKASELLS